MKTKPEMTPKDEMIFKVCEKFTSMMMEKLKALSVMENQLETEWSPAKSYTRSETTSEDLSFEKSGSMSPTQLQKPKAPESSPKSIVGEPWIPHPLSIGASFKDFTKAFLAVRKRHKKMKLLKSQRFLKMKKAQQSQ